MGFKTVIFCKKLTVHSTIFSCDSLPACHRQQSLKIGTEYNSPLLTNERIDHWAVASDNCYDFFYLTKTNKL